MFCRFCNLILQSKDHRDAHYAKGTCFPPEESLQKIVDRADDAKRNLRERKRHERKHRKNNRRRTERARSSSVDNDDVSVHQKCRRIEQKEIPVVELSDSGNV